jgi:DmsE family decaheme c-type cytochrome
MNKLITSLVVGAAAVALALVGGSYSPVQAGDPSADCATCHEEIAADFQHTPHAVTAAGGPSCVTCHGDGARHMEEGGAAGLIGKPAGRDGEVLCLACHQQHVETMFSSRSVHSDSALWCGSCHNVHAKAPSQARLLTTGANELCASCHPAAAGSFNKPFGHQLDRGGLECVSCHNPHGGAGEESLKLDRSGDGPCLSCHAEKRGPFVFPHVTGVTGDCMTCHVPHGASNPMALTRARVDQLCLECHSAIEGGTLGSQPPSFHDLRSPRYQNCTTCHVTVHGSNASPLFLK